MPSEDEGPETRAYRVRGRVQGVGFRWWTRSTAVELGLGGTVRNRRDGAVEIHATGTASKLDAFEDMLRKGPRFARVDALEVLDGQPVEDADEFRIDL